MIHIDRDRVPVPAHLRTPGTGGMKEQEDALKFFDPAAANRDRSWGKNYQAYKHPEVKQALRDLFHGKCAYCESPLPTQPAEVEHYRPKGEVIVDGRARRPGYYWLAASWENLLPSCIDCNRERNQEIPGVGARKVGKANRFPIANETCRDHPDRMVPGLEKVEKPLLLHPCLDAPEKHLEFVDEGSVRPALTKKRGKEVESPIGAASIEAYALQRTELVSVRRDRLLMVQEQIVRVQELLEELDAHPQPNTEQKLQRETVSLKRFLDDRAPYAGMARQWVLRLLPAFDS